MPLGADESCHDRGTLDKLRGKYQVVNIKLDKTGGLTEALALAEDARAHGFQLMVGCMVATSLSMAPAMIVKAATAVNATLPAALRMALMLFSPSLKFQLPGISRTGELRFRRAV